MELLLASGNPGKVQGVRDASAGSGIDWLSLTDVAERSGRPVPAEPDEDQDTFEGNALLKASHYAEWAGMPTVSDDSGLVVDALGGDPGVRSARYADAPDGAPREERDAANNAKLIRELAGVPGAVDASLETYSPHKLCTYAYDLASTFTSFYEACPILKSDEPLRTSRLALADLTARVLERALFLLGIAAPDEM